MDKPFAITLDVGSSRANHTGAWRTERPVYVHNLPPCNNACPAGENMLNRILEMGVTLELNTRVTDIRAELESGFDAAFVAVGAHIGKRAYIPAGDSARIMDAVSMLHSMEDGALSEPMLGRRVAVYGGGNTAMDAARTARRLGASEAVTFSDGVVEVGADLMTGYPGLFAGGDMVPAERTVTVAIGHGKKAARNIDAWLRRDRYAAPAKHPLAESARLNTWYYADAPATVRPQLEAARRITTFDEVTGGLDSSTALFEARRCMSCGNCFGCDNCYGVCPDNAVIKLGDGQYEFDYDYCKGCGLCVAECPCGSIEMQPEQT